jgi:AAA domain-containing protein
MLSNKELKDSIARAELEIMEKRMNERTEQIKTALVPFQNAGSLNWLYKEPEPEKFIFKKPGPFNTSEGFMPKGMPCMLISPGGSGKSWALLQAAIAAATGTKWFNYFKCERPIKVVYISAEDSIAQLWRRSRKIFFGHNLDMSSNHKDNFNNNFFPIALNGLCLEICDTEGLPTNEYYELEKYLHTMQEVQLLILDPASSFYGCSENESKPMRRWITLLHKLTHCPGNPTVLIAHHTNKSAFQKTKDNEVNFDQSFARGSSAIADGVRWMACLEKKDTPENDRVLFRLIKSNYSAFPPPLELMRDYEWGGILRYVPNAESDNNSNQKKTKNATINYDFNVTGEEYF